MSVPEMHSFIFNIVFFALSAPLRWSCFDRWDCTRWVWQGWSLERKYFSGENRDDKLGV